MSTTPTTGMSFHANGSGIPKTAKYGSHAALVMTPKAPCPMKQAATATRRDQVQHPGGRRRHPLVEPIGKSQLERPARARRCALDHGVAL